MGDNIPKSKKTARQEALETRRWKRRNDTIKKYAQQRAEQEADKSD